MCLNTTEAWFEAHYEHPPHMLNLPTCVDSGGEHRVSLKMRAHCMQIDVRYLEALKSKRRERDGEGMGDLKPDTQVGCTDA